MLEKLKKKNNIFIFLIIIIYKPQGIAQLVEVPFLLGGHEVKYPRCPWG